jgi:hypothetical protein
MNLMLINRWILSFALLTLAVSGCGRQPEQQSSSESPAASQAPAAAPAPPPVMVGPREISGYVFEDKNRNGQFDTGDERLGSQTVLVTNLSATKRLHNATTDGTGSFRFGDLPDGEYRVSVLVPDGFDRTNDDSFSVTVLGNQPMAEVHFGVARR